MKHGAPGRRDTGDTWIRVHSFVSLLLRLVRLRFYEMQRYVGQRVRGNRPAYEALLSVRRSRLALTVLTCACLCLSNEYSFSSALALAT